MTTKIAIPTANQTLCAHFGHCEAFYIASIVDNKITEESYITPPAHEPGLYPAWVAQHGVTLVIAGGMGQKAKDLFAKENIEVLVGAPFDNPKTLIENYLENNLVTGNNSCNH